MLSKKPYWMCPAKPSRNAAISGRANRAENGARSPAILAARPAGPPQEDEHPDGQRRLHRPRHQEERVAPEKLTSRPPIAGPSSRPPL